MAKTTSAPTQSHSTSVTCKMTADEQSKEQLPGMPTASQCGICLTGMRFGSYFVSICMRLSERRKGKGVQRIKHIIFHFSYVCLTLCLSLGASFSVQFKKCLLSTYYDLALFHRCCRYKDILHIVSAIKEFLIVSRERVNRKHS